MGPPLGFLPYHRNDRFPRSTQEPDSRSRHLYAGRRPGSKQDSPELIPEYQQPPVLTSSLSFRHLISGSLALASLIIPDLVLRGLFLNAHHPGSLPAQLKVVWSLLLQADSEGPPLISRAVAHAYYSKRPRGALTCQYMQLKRSSDMVRILGGSTATCQCVVAGA